MLWTRPDAEHTRHGRFHPLASLMTSFPAAISGAKIAGAEVRASCPTTRARRCPAQGISVLVEPWGGGAHDGIIVAADFHGIARHPHPACLDQHVAGCGLIKLGRLGDIQQGRHRHASLMDHLQPMLCILRPEYGSCSRAFWDSATGFECPSSASIAQPAVAAQFGKLLSKGAALEQANELMTSIHALRTHGVSKDTAINLLIAEYCPAVAADTGLSDEEKDAKVRNFAQHTTETVLASTFVETSI